MNYEIIDCSSTQHVIVDNNTYGFFHDSNDQCVYWTKFGSGNIVRSPHPFIISDSLDGCLEYIEENNLICN